MPSKLTLAPLVLMSSRISLTCAALPEMRKIPSSFSAESFLSACRYSLTILWLRRRGAASAGTARLTWLGDEGGEEDSFLLEVRMRWKKPLPLPLPFSDFFSSVFCSSLNTRRSSSLRSKLASVAMDSISCMLRGWNSLQSLSSEATLPISASTCCSASATVSLEFTEITTRFCLEATSTLMFNASSCEDASAGVRVIGRTNLWGASIDSDIARLLRTEVVTRSPMSLSSTLMRTSFSGSAKVAFFSSVSWKFTELASSGASEELALPTAAAFSMSMEVPRGSLRPVLVALPGFASIEMHASLMLLMRGGTSPLLRPSFPPEIFFLLLSP
mmetsp:Transcript_10866/g.44490  ORF Transcript_10866/g.44490 Transcript_10866/m.44490 type:complete len:330 (-) Transcript_10866:807-1796(-)